MSEKTKMIGVLLLGAVLSFFSTNVLLSVRTAQADQSYYQPNQMTQAQVACNFELATVQNVTVSGTSAATSLATGRGSVWVTCTTDAYMRVAAYGATGAATATTSNGVLVPQWTPWQIYSRGSFFSFIQATTGGTCQVAECM